MSGSCIDIRCSSSSDLFTILRQLTFSSLIEGDTEGCHMADRFRRGTLSFFSLSHTYIVPFTDTLSKTSFTSSFRLWFSLVLSQSFFLTSRTFWEKSSVIYISVFFSLGQFLNIKSFSRKSTNVKITGRILFCFLAPNRWHLSTPETLTFKVCLKNVLITLSCKDSKVSFCCAFKP